MLAFLLACVLGLFLGLRRWLFLVALAVAFVVSPFLALLLLLVAGGAGTFRNLNRKDH